MNGYVYALINPSFNGMVKIGKTTRSPKERASELSKSTGVPTPFIVIYDIFVIDCDAAERHLHDLLTVNGFRVSENREFFEVDLKFVIDAMKECELIFECKSHEPVNSEDECLEKSYLAEEYGPAYSNYKELLNEAHAYMNGLGDVFKDERKAENKLRMALKLGSPHAAYELGLLYFNNRELQNYDSCEDVLLEGLRLISDFKARKVGTSSFPNIEVSCLHLLARIYKIRNNDFNSKKAIGIILENYSTEFKVIRGALKLVPIIHWTKGSNTVVSDALEKFFSEVSIESLLEPGFSYDYHDITDRVDALLSFVFYYFQHIAEGCVPLVKSNLLILEDLNNFKKIKSCYYFDYSLFKINIELFEEGIEIYKKSFLNVGTEKHVTNSSSSFTKGAPISYSKKAAIRNEAENKNYADEAIKPSSTFTPTQIIIAILVIFSFIFIIS